MNESRLRIESDELAQQWLEPRWQAITRGYEAEEVVRLRGSVVPECTLARDRKSVV